MCACVYEREVLVGYPGHAGLPLPLLHPPCARREAAELPHTPRVRQPVKKCVSLPCSPSGAMAGDRERLELFGACHRDWKED